MRERRRIEVSKSRATGPTSVGSCPHCGSKKEPERNYEKTLSPRLNPWKCVDCGGVGGGVDFGLFGEDDASEFARELTKRDPRRRR